MYIVYAMPAYYLEALEFDEFFHSVHDENFIVIVNIADVAGVEPPIHINSPSGGRRIIQIL